MNHLLGNQSVHTFSNKALTSRPNLGAVIHCPIIEETSTYLFSEDIEKIRSTSM